MTSRLSVRNLLLIFIVAVLAGVAFTVWQHFTSITPEQLVEALPDNIDVAFDNVDYTETRGDKRLWRLQADSVAHEAQRQAAHLENVRMVFFDQGEFGDIQLTAERGEWFSETGNVELSGNVVAKGDQGQALYCQQLSYDNEAELITSESAVRLIARGMEVTGKGLSFSLPQQLLVIPQQVQSQFSDW